VKKFNISTIKKLGSLKLRPGNWKEHPFKMKKSENGAGSLPIAHTW